MHVDIYRSLFIYMSKENDRFLCIYMSNEHYRSLFICMSISTGLFSYTCQKRF